MFPPRREKHTLQPSARNPYAIAVVLAALAGWVDVIGFTRWHGLYVSFMSGNSTALGAALSKMQWHGGAQLVGVIASFVGGVTAGEIIFKTAGARSYSYVLIIEAGFLGLTAILDRANTDLSMTAMLLALAMGVQNASIHRAGGVSVALTYVTGTLVHFGRTIAGGLMGSSSWRAGLPYFGLWLGLVAGAASGAVAIAYSVECALGTACLVALFLAMSASPNRQMAG